MGAEVPVDMWNACDNAFGMSKMIQIRNVPDEIHRILKIRAVNAGMSLSEFLLREVTRAAARPDVEVLLADLASKQPVKVSNTPAEILREERELRS